MHENEIDNGEGTAAPVPERPAGPTLGLLLRKAREARGLTIDDVVQSLKFSSRQIEAIEEDRMDVLPGSVFVRGLIRSYARLLKLDPEPMLGLIDASVPVREPDIRAPDNMGKAGPKSGILRTPPLVLISIVLIVAMAGLMTWYYFGEQASGLLASARSDVVAGDEPKATEVAKQPVATVQPATVEVVPPVPAVPETAPASPEVREAAAPAKVSSVTAPPATTEHKVSLDFSGESWIEVKDASGLVILTGIYTSGTHAATGRPPFEVVIGNAGAVKLFHDGRAVDLKPFTRSEVSRLTLE